MVRPEFKYEPIRISMKRKKNLRYLPEAYKRKRQMRRDAMAIICLSSVLFFLLLIICFILAKIHVS